MGRTDPHEEGSRRWRQRPLDDGTGEPRTILSGIHAFYEPEELVGKTLQAITNLPPRPMMGVESCGMLISAIHHEEGEEKLHLLMVDPRRRAADCSPRSRVGAEECLVFKSLQVICVSGLNRLRQKRPYRNSALPLRKALSVCQNPFF